MARKVGQGKEEEESRARQQEEKTPVRDEEKTPACDGRGHHVVEQASYEMIMWFFIYTMEYYAAEKNNDIMKFTGKWMELENVILSKTHPNSILTQLYVLFKKQQQQQQKPNIKSNLCSLNTLGHMVLY
ncbi:hypothetical protein STEG23_026867 [Scotinomys teguina]